MHTYFQQQDSNPLVEIHLCVRSLLLLCLQDINNDNELKGTITNVVTKWSVGNTSIKFYFLRKGVPTNRNRFQNFVEKDLMRAAEGLRGTYWCSWHFLVVNF
ncbi:hypothetical protein PtrSN002B_001795 [Pyrenophora tritici-repentis]|nr:hypothetical protein PtrV1_02306 [Pyrenophora tritici-repentis]KAF7455056.1 hypothetical protein A1F99_023140 [Pyrenophora tritici-repentis]KAF7578214.1 hypothetical protein PtrM4_024540 [Pyrenophora tritici-repentis]KAG9388809.1 hypothetical protein A1F94_001702 [Pyrenophora tritici-repentis]KAI0573106.1 hypothetical protein Alg215_09394 [Pyrenophora tritici-repentis]